MNLIVQLKHFVRYDEYGNILPRNKVRYDYDQDMIFYYDGSILRLQGSSWSKQVKPEDAADAIKAYFSGTNYVIANIVKQLD